MGTGDGSRGPSVGDEQRVGSRDWLQGFREVGSGSACDITEGRGSPRIPDLERVLSCPQLSWVWINLCPSRGRTLRPAVGGAHRRPLFVAHAQGPCYVPDSGLTR